MAQRVDNLSGELQALFSEWSVGGEALALMRPTKAEHDAVAVLAKELPMEALLRDVGIVAAQAVGDAIQQLGLRPADYANDRGVVDALAARLSKSLPSEVFTAAFQASLKGRG